MEANSLSRRSGGLCAQILRTPASSASALAKFCPIKRRAIHAQQCSTGLRSGLLGGHSGSTCTPFLAKKPRVETEVWHVAPSCWNTMGALPLFPPLRLMKFRFGVRIVSWYAWEFCLGSHNVSLALPATSIHSHIIIEMLNFFSCFKQFCLNFWAWVLHTLIGPSLKRENLFSSEKRT